MLCALLLNAREEPTRGRGQAQAGLLRSDAGHTGGFLDLGVYLKSQSGRPQGAHRQGQEKASSEGRSFLWTASCQLSPGPVLVDGSEEKVQETQPFCRGSPGLPSVSSGNPGLRVARSPGVFKGRRKALF